MARFPNLIKISNLIIYLSFAVLITEPEFRFETHSTYIHPNIYVFYFWNLIRWLLSIFLIYQFTDTADEIIVDGIGWHFATAASLTIAWLILTVLDYLVIAWIIIIIVATQLSYIYHNLKHNYPPENRFDTFFIHLPFCIYHAWIMVIAAISTFVAFAPDKEDDKDPSVLVETLAVLALLLLELVVISYIEKFKYDLVGAGIITITLYGIAIQQNDFYIHWTSLVLAVVDTIYIGKTYIEKYHYERGVEEAPLLGY